MAGCGSNQPRCPAREAIMTKHETPKDWNEALSAGMNAREAADRHWAEEMRGNETETKTEMYDDAGLRAWPILGGTAKHGIIGEMARLATKDSEADPIAVMMTAQVWASACFGR